MSHKERERLKLMNRIIKKEVTRKEAAGMLRMTERHLYRIIARYKQDGDEGLIHGLRGCLSNHGYGKRVRDKVTEIYRVHYHDYGPKLFSEMLAAHHDLRIAPETVRRWLIRKQLWLGERKARQHRKHRERRSSIGAMIQFDGSDHDWFEGRAKRCSLLVAVDDASGRIFLRFAQTESTQTVLRFFLEYVQRFGIPEQVYTDYGSVYHANRSRKRALRENNGYEANSTDYQRALTYLGVELIYARSPQAKGRVERSNRTHQDRLIKALRRNGISSIDAANRFLDSSYLDEHNKEFAHTEHLNDIHRPCAYTRLELERIFCFQQYRKVYNDTTITFNAQFYQLEKKGNAALPPPRENVAVCTFLDGTLHIFWQKQELHYCKIPTLPRPIKKTNSRRGTIPSDDHPWRKSLLIGRAKRTRNKKIQKLKNNLLSFTSPA